MAAQIPDIIIVSGEKKDLLTNPLESYWADSGKRKPAFQISDSCQRGYVATWQILQNELVLSSIDDEFYQQRFLLGKKLVKTSLQLLFPQCKGQSVKANWYCGKLRVPVGNMTAYAPHAYDSRFEKEMIISVDKGIIIKVATLDFTKQQLIIDRSEIQR